MAQGDEWTRDQLLIALRLYLRTRFGRLHGKNPEIITLAAKIGRTPGALAMKASNYAHIDPKLDRKGLSKTGQGARNIWAEFEKNPTKIALQTEAAASKFNLPQPKIDQPIGLPTGPTERTRVVKVRLVQTFFRDAVHITYKGKCAISGLSTPGLLTAAHIIPWSVSQKHRANPRNGLCLNALFDRAFDRGLLTFDEEMRVVLSVSLRNDAENSALACSLLESEGKQLHVPDRFPPLAEALKYHRENIFKCA